MGIASFGRPIERGHISFIKSWRAASVRMSCCFSRTLLCSPAVGLRTANSSSIGGLIRNRVMMCGSCRWRETASHSHFCRRRSGILKRSSPRTGVGSLTGQTSQGRPEVYVQTFPASGGKWQVSTNGGHHPQWRGDGKELFYCSGDGKLMAVDVKPAELRGRLAEDAVRSRGGEGLLRRLCGDGGRPAFSLRPHVAGDSPAQFSVVVNWTAEAPR